MIIDPTGSYPDRRGPRPPTESPVIKNPPLQEDSWLSSRELTSDKIYFWSESLAHPSSPLRSKKIILSFAELGIDLLFSLSLCCFYLVFFAIFNQLTLKKEYLDLQIFFYLWTSCLFQYQILTRVFLGFSIGEWACRDWPRS